uniref:Uncharacterized protein n=1 Tax=Polysiphonia sp. TaxID=1967842 RepID=A0A1Z1MTI9_9FLOR|nr:hypothetical protein [Polysiphonia sp.]
MYYFFIIWYLMFKYSYLEIMSVLKFDANINFKFIYLLKFSKIYCC